MTRLFCLLAIVLLSGCAAYAQRSQPTLQEDTVQAAESALDNAADSLRALAGYVWHSAENGMSVQFGVPETDDRAFRVDCEGGMLFIIAPANTNAPEGTSTTAAFQNGERRAGTISYLGDGPNFVVPLAPTDPLIRTLLTNGRIRIDALDTVVSVAGSAGLALLQPLVERCRNQKP